MIPSQNTKTSEVLSIEFSLVVLHEKLRLAIHMQTNNRKYKVTAAESVKKSIVNRPSHAMKKTFTSIASIVDVTIVAFTADENVLSPYPSVVFYVRMGMLKANVAPLPSLLFSAHIFPPWDSTIFFARKRPSPVPFSDLVANLVKRLG